MIDQAAIKRDAVANLADWPVNIRHYYTAVDYHQVTAGLNATDEVSALLDGGLLDNFSVEFIVIADTLSPLPMNRDRVDLQLRDGSWKQLEIKRTPDFLDPLTPTLQFRAGNPGV